MNRCWYSLIVASCFIPFVGFSSYMEGYILLYRKIIDNPYYFSEPFTHSQAWIDMLLIANHKSGYIYKRGVKIEVKRGQIGYDSKSLSSRWKWSRGKVLRFLDELEIDQQIVQQKNNLTTLISICNYDSYQIDSTPKSKPKRYTDGTQTDTNNNDNKDNVNTLSTWRDDFLIYKKECHAAFSKYRKDNEFLNQLQYYHPNVNIQKTIDKAYETYWSKEEAWIYKKNSKPKIKNINWEKTITNAVNQSFNKVYYTRQELADI